VRIKILMRCLQCGKTAFVTGWYRGGVEPDVKSVEEKFEEVCAHSKYTGDDSHEIVEYYESDY
jgi:hypothetical protein